MKKIFSLIVVALSASVLMAGEAPKFVMAVSSEAKVSAVVLPNFELQVNLPDSENCYVDPSHVSVYVEMNDVSSLGISEQAVFQDSMKTGMPSSSVSLLTWLSNVYGLADTTIMNVDVVGDEFSLALTRSDYVVFGVPSDTAAARIAIQKLMKGVVSTSPQVEKGFLLVKKGSILKVGNEQMEFIGDVKLALDSAALLKMMNDFVDSTMVGKVSGITPEGTFITSLSLAKGSVIAVNPVLNINKEVKISFDCSKACQGDPVNEDVLSNMRDGIINEKSAGGKLHEALRYVVKFINDVVGQANESGECDVKIEFEGSVTNVNNVTAATPEVKKMFKNGQLIIVKDGQMFNAQGIAL